MTVIIYACRNGASETLLPRTRLGIMDAQLRAAFLPRRAKAAAGAGQRDPGLDACCTMTVTMLLGTGVDAVEVERIRRSLERFGEQFISRIFTEQEAAYCRKKRASAESYAARFAAKEAGAKALGTGIARGVSWRDLEVERQPGERPMLRLHGRARDRAAHMGVERISLAITHTSMLAIATVHMEDGT